MSGHSKWSQIKRQKGTADAKRGQLFTKLTREIIIAARQGGTSPEANFRLRLAIQKARDSNMPLENIERAIKRVVVLRVQLAWWSLLLRGMVLTEWR